MAQLLVLHGPNLNLLGTREPSYYGETSLAILDDRLKNLANNKGHQLTSFQSNAEGNLIDAIHQAAKQQIDYIIINPAALTHTSIALRDALLAVNIPFIEVHISNIYRRETFRHHSYLADIAQGTLCGFGTLGYELAVQAAIQQLETTRSWIFEKSSN